MVGAEPSSRRGFQFGSPAPHLHLFSDASRSGWGACLLDRSRVRGVFEDRNVVPHLSSRFGGDVFALPSIPEGVTVLCVTVMGDASTVVPSGNEQGGTVSHFLCSLPGRLLWWSECLDHHLEVPRLSSWMPFAFIKASWVCMLFHPSFRRIRCGSSRRGPGLSWTLVAPLWLGKVWFEDLPVPFSWFSWCPYVVAWFWSVLPVSGSHSALLSVFALQDLVCTICRGNFCVP